MNRLGVGTSAFRHFLIDDKANRSIVILMKKLFVLVMITVLLSGCASMFTPRIGTLAEDREAATIVAAEHYRIVSGKVTYYASSFSQARIFFAQVYRGEVRGYIMVNKSVDPAAIEWSRDGDFYNVGP